jgi:vacuolar-type H+-ATPase subunit H
MAKHKPLVSQYLEAISGTALDKYQRVIRAYVRQRHGVYALYRRDKLYYVGLAKNLRNRLKHHLKDKHRGKWDRFSVYLTIGDSHLKELESLLLRIVQPTGNAQRGKFAKADDLKRRLARDMKKYYQSEVDALLNRKRADLEQEAERIVAETSNRPLAGLVDKRYKLRVRYKGKWYRARLRSDGRIRYGGKLYDSPSAAGHAVRKKPTNGWWFWTYERAPGDWVQLRELRR